MRHEDSVTEKEAETKIHFLARLYDWIMVVPDCLGTDVNRIKNRQKTLLKGFSTFYE